MIGSQDLLVVLAIGVFFFGAKRLPELSRSLGQALSEFKKGVTSGGADSNTPVEAPKTEAAAKPAKEDGSAGA